MAMSTLRGDRSTAIAEETCRSSDGTIITGATEKSLRSDDDFDEPGHTAIRNRERKHRVQEEDVLRSLESRAIKRSW